MVGGGGGVIFFDVLAHPVKAKNKAMQKENVEK
jgi:hypothetical protein